MDDSLLDAAFELAVRAYSAAGHAQAKDRLQQRFPQIGFATITEAYLAACRLHELAYGAADQYRDKACSDHDALALLQERCAGFPARTYQRAFAQGLYESR